MPKLLLKSKYHPQSLRIVVSVRGQKFIDQSWGRSATFFDVASLTKIMVTTPLCMELYQKNALDLRKTAGHYLGFLQSTPVGKIKIKDLLRHYSGLEAWRAFYKKVHSQNDLKDLIKKEKVVKHKIAVYSDLDFIILGWIIEELLEMPLDEAALTYLFKPLEMAHTFFNPDARFKSLKSFAPTRNTKPRGLLQGQVFDDNTWSVGGVSGQAGLFSTAQDVLKMGSYFLELYNSKQKSFRVFTKRAMPKTLGDWALGFTLPSRPLSTGGALISDLAFGHVGYTGTSLWVDPKRQAVVVILSNGTYPDGSNLHFKDMRRVLHDQIWEMIDHG